MSYLGPSLRRARRRPSAGRRLLAAVALSVGLNLLLLSTLDLSWLGLAQGEAARRDVNLAALTARDWEANRAVLPPGARPAIPPPPAPAPPPPAPAPPPPPPPRADPQVDKKQVVDIGGPDDSAPAPDDARYLAQRNSRVERETKARSTGKYPEVVGPAEVKPQASAPRGALDARPDFSRGRREQASRPELALNLPQAGSQPVPRQEPGRPGDEGGDGDRPPTPGSAGPLGLPNADGKGRKLDLHPRAALMEQLSGGPAPDYLADVEEGDATFLNTQQWKFAGFFNRIARQLYPPWTEELETAVTARDPTLQRFLYKDRYTRLAVRLNPHGDVLSVAVVQSSGVEFLDQVAKKAVERTAPFANPPPGMFDGRGEAVFTWGFQVIGSHAGRMNFSIGPNAY